MSVAVERKAREDDSRAWLAWHIAALSRAQKLPKLEAMLTQREKTKPQDWKQQRAIARMWTIALGGKVH